MAELNMCEKTSDEVIEEKCGPCSPDLYVKAYGYCTDCSEYLCETCFKVHLRIPPCRNHNLVEKKDIPADCSILKTNDVCTETCSKHNDKVIEYFCEVHSVCGCSHCIIKDHRQCEGLVCVSEVADGIYESQEYKDMKNHLEVAESRNKENQNDLKENKSKAEKAFQRTTKQANEFSARLKDFIDKLENVTVNNIIEIKENELKRLNSLSNKCKEYDTKISFLRKGIDDPQSVGAKCNSFIAMKKANIELRIVSSQLDALHQQTVLKNDVDENYRANPDLVKLFDTVTNLGIWSVIGDEHQQKATLTLRLEDVSRPLYARQHSEIIRFQELPWSITAYETNSHLAFFVECHVDARNRWWSCNVSADMTIINQLSKIRSKIRAITAVFKHSESGWGYDNFIKVDELLDPDNGFCVDDSIILEACIKANNPEGI